MTRLVPAILGLLLTAGTVTSHAQTALFPQTNADESPSFLGVLLQDVTANDLEKLGLKREGGAICAEVVEGTPAEQAGLEADDVLVRWDGMRVRSARQLKRLVEDTPVGRKVKVAILRDGENENVQVTVGERPAYGLQNMPFHNFNPGQQMQLGPWHPPIDGNANPFSDLVQPEPPRLGVAMRALTDQLGQYFGLDDDQTGVLVVSVVEDSPADVAGFRAGDVITEIDGEPVSGPSEVQAGIRRADHDVEIAILRNKKVRNLKAKLSDGEADDGMKSDDDLREEISYPRGTM